MKKSLFLLLLLIVPFIVKADSGLIIEKIEYDSKTDLAEVVEEPTFEENKINLNVRFYNLNDYIKYKITLKNDTDKDYEISSEVDLTEYITIGFEPLDSNDNLLKSNSTKTVYFIIKYANEVPLEEFENSSAITTEEVKSIELSVKDNTIVVETKNPYTKSSFSLVLGVIAFISAITIAILLKNKKKFKGIVAVLIVGIMAIPISIFALDKITIEVDSKIEIKHPSFFISNSYSSDGATEYLFDYGMTWREYMNSNYYKEEMNWEIVTYLEEHHYTPSGSSNENISYHYLPDNQEGISLWKDSVNCGNPYANQWIGNNHVIQAEDGYPTPDTEIINGYVYNYYLGTMC